MVDLTSISLLINAITIVIFVFIFGKVIGMPLGIFILLLEQMGMQNYVCCSLHPPL